MAVDEETLGLNSSVQPIVEQGPLFNSKESKNKKLKDHFDKLEEWHFKVHRPKGIEMLVSLQSLDDNNN